MDDGVCGYEEVWVGGVWAGGGVPNLSMRFVNPLSEAPIVTLHLEAYRKSD